jgi:arabinose-5-phosphate isomerase
MEKQTVIERVQHTLAEAREAVERLGSVHESVWAGVYNILSTRRGKIILTGVGKSSYVAMKTAATLTSLGHTAFFVHPVEALHGDSGAVEEGDVLCAFSYSGNTKELTLFLRHVRTHTKVAVIGISGGADSELARLSDVVVPISIRSEGCPLNDCDACRW